MLRLRIALAAAVTAAAFGLMALAPIGPGYAGPWRPLTKEAYPAKARLAQKGGWARLACRINRQGQAAECHVYAESEPGLGFGYSGLALFGAPPVASLIGRDWPAGDWVTVETRFAFRVGAAQEMYGQYSARFGRGDPPAAPPEPAPAPEARPAPPAAASSRLPRPMPAPSPAEGPGIVYIDQPIDPADYPEAGRRDGVVGSAVMACKVDAAGYVAGCRLTSESPAGYGFGAAALKVFGRPLAARLAYGRRPVGETVTVRISFRRARSQSWQPGGRAILPGRYTINTSLRFGAGELPSEIPPAPMPPAASPPPPAAAPGDSGPVPLPPPPPQPTAIPRDMWLAKPTGEDLARLYPEEAARQDVPGRAVISCTIAHDGRLADCVVVSEDPPGMGFGQAALGAAPFFRMAAKTPDGAPTEGRTVRIPIAFRFQ